MIKLGEAEILRVEEFTRPAAFAQFGADPQLVADNLDWLAPTFLDVEAQTFPFAYQTWIVRCGGLTVVVDPCTGNGRERPALPHLDHLDTPYLERFEATGVRPADVDYVFCTHLHCDHCGWNTRLSGGRWVPTFPNAHYVFVRRETERWDPTRGDHRVVDYNVGVYEDSVLPVIEAGLAELVGDRHEIAPGLTVEPAYGHTLGHSTLTVQTGANELVFTGDAFHHPVQVLDPTLRLRGCDDLDAAIATRRRLCVLLAERRAVMLPAHFPPPHAGRVERRGERFCFLPINAGGEATWS